MTQYGAGKDIPIDIIGYASFDLVFHSRAGLEDEEFDFEIVDIPSSWDRPVEQLVAHSKDEEIKNLRTLCTIVAQSDIITGHNILGFDNLQVINRMSHFLKDGSLSPSESAEFKEFLGSYTQTERSFHFGTPSEIGVFYPSSFDTYHAARKFYSLDDYSLSGIASFLRIQIPDRIQLAPENMGLDEKTFRYNRQDVQEQIGLTLSLLQQAFPLSFTTNMPFEILLSSGATKMWDFMAMIRAAYHKKIMPPIARVFSIAGEIGRFGSTKAEIAEACRKNGVGQELLRIVKYGDEMPDWVEYPYVINEKGSIAYHIPGGMTIKPDTDAHSSFIPWFHVIVADVGAMYPTILRAVNAGADTVRVARPGETPDEWVWLRSLPAALLERILWRKPQEDFADEGYMVGIHISKEDGVVNRAMGGLMDQIDKVKQEMKQKKGDDKKRLQMIYQSLKGARNAGTHGILSAPKVSCRQFNLWGAALITTKGQQILNNTLQILEKRGIRVVYGDTDGIYLACSNTASEDMQKVLNASTVTPREWLTSPEEAITSIEVCNDRWRKELSYQKFELEPEVHDAMIFVKHKNYLIFDMDDKDTRIVMTTKGNNFKGSDKPVIARLILKDIMMDVLSENLVWDDEQDVQRSVKQSIKKTTEQEVTNLDLTKVNLADLTLVQSVQSPGFYKPNPDGSPSVFMQRATALESLIGKIRVRKKLRFVVTKNPLPGIRNPSKSSVKPIHYMYPVDILKNPDDIDLAWYREMIEKYVQGAFGLHDLTIAKQEGLEKWM
jgi:DNA polymerase elongation subunit (family B)